MILPKGSLLQNGKYSIEKVLGQGGFGITYLATQVGLNRKVAIKEFFMKEYCNRDEATSHVSVPSVGSVDLVAKFRQKFIKEAQTIAEMENPHIVHIYDVFEDNGTAYYAMQFVDGGCLNDLTPFTIDEAVLYIKQIADALGYCHKRKILHLDVKPANILLKDNNAVLIDFGISKHYDDQGGQTSSTPVGISKGYAPLEQYNRSDMSSFTPSTDIYSLGATLYKLITGQTPPDANYVHENGVELPDDIPFNVRNAIIKSMEPRRKDRPQSIAEFLKLLDGEGVKTQDDDEATEIVGVERPKPTEPKKEELKQDLPNEQKPKKKKSKAWIFILLAIIIGGAGYYFVNEKMKGEKKKEAEMLAQAEQERIKKEQEAAQIAQARKEAEAKQKAEAERKKKEEEAKRKAEQERLEKERQELEAEKAELEAQKAEQARLEAERAEQARIEAERKRKEEEAKRKAEQERLEKERQLYSQVDEFYCDGVYDPDESEYKNGHGLHTPDLNINKDHFRVSFSFKAVKNDENYIQWVLVLSSWNRVLGVCLKNDGKVYVTTNNNINYYETDLNYSINEYVDIDMVYEDGILYMNGQQIDIDMKTPHDGQFHSVNYANGIAFKGYIKDLRIYSYPD